MSDSIHMRQWRTHNSINQGIAGRRHIWEVRCSDEPIVTIIIICRRQGQYIHCYDFIILFCKFFGWFLPLLVRCFRIFQLYSIYRLMAGAYNLNICVNISNILRNWPRTYLFLSWAFSLLSVLVPRYSSSSVLFRLLSLAIRDALIVKNLSIYFIKLLLISSTQLDNTLLQSITVRVRWDEQLLINSMGWKCT